MKTLNDLIRNKKLYPGDRGSVYTMIRPLDSQNIIDYMYNVVIPILQKHNTNLSVEVNVNAYGPIVVNFDRYMLIHEDKMPHHKEKQYSALLELCSICNVKINVLGNNYILDQFANIEQIVEEFEA